MRASRIVRFDCCAQFTYRLSFRRNLWEIAQRLHTYLER